MGRKRKAQSTLNFKSEATETKYDFEHRFDDSEDDFYTGRDKVLLDVEPATKRRKRIAEQERDIQPSDEEVFEQAESEDDLDSERSSENETGVDEEHETNWGTTKADYYNADVIETEVDALDEEKEAKRLQQKQLKNITDADFGFDELAWTQPEVKNIVTGPVIEKLPEARIPAGAIKQTVVEVLYARYPEFQPLASDFIELQHIWNKLQKLGIERQKRSGITKQTKFQALTAYLGAIAMYFAVMASNIDADADATKITSYPPSHLREHAIIENLISTRQLWNETKDVEELQVKAEIKPVVEVPLQTQTSLRPKDRKPKTKPKKKRTATPKSFDEDLEMPVAVPARKALDLQSLLAQSATMQELVDSDFGDEGPLTAQQAEEKARKKKSLRFYTSQIAQKANKRGAASREAGGDDDLPRKERLREKQERLLLEAERRGQQKATADEELGGDSEDEHQSLQDDDYYQSLVADSKRKKEAKQAKAIAYAEAARQGGQVYEEEQVGLDGKRKITYAIEKNKGLAPKRKKDVRNPRVKKRKKFDEKMKKLGSIRQVYKGGEGRGRYGGELTGIKTNVVKSVKL